MSNGIYYAPSAYRLEVVDRTLSANPIRSHGALPFDSIQYGREGDQPSQATIRMALDDLQLNEPLTCWRHLICVYRDDELAWCGPVTGVQVFPGRKVTITCVDWSASWAAKVIQSDVQYRLRPDRDGQTIPGSTPFGYDLVDSSNGYTSDGGGFSYAPSSDELMGHVASEARSTDPADTILPDAFLSDMGLIDITIGGGTDPLPRNYEFSAAQGQTVPEAFRVQQQEASWPWTVVADRWVYPPHTGYDIGTVLLGETSLVGWTLSLDGGDYRNELFYNTDGYTDPDEEALPAIDSYSWVEGGESSPIFPGPSGDDQPWRLIAFPGAGRMQGHSSEEEAEREWAKRSRPVKQLEGVLAGGAAVDFADLVPGAPVIFQLEQDVDVRGLRRRDQRQDAHLYVGAPVPPGQIFRLQSVTVDVSATEQGLTEEVKVVCVAEGDIS